MFPFGSETTFFFVSTGLPASKDQKRRWVKQATCPENEQKVLITKDTRASRSQNKNQNRWLIYGWPHATTSGRGPEDMVAGCHREGHALHG